MTIFDDTASKNMGHHGNQSDTMGLHNTDEKAIRQEIKRLEMELAYSEQAKANAAAEDWYVDFDDDDPFEADNDNDNGFKQKFDTDFPGQVAAERNCFRFMSVMEELKGCEIINVSLSYDRDGNPVCNLKYWDGAEAKADVMFEVNKGLEDAPVRTFAPIR